MKKIAVILMIIFVSAKVNAQSFYLQGGVNLANISTSNDGSSQKSNTLTTFNAGFMNRFDTSGVIGFEAGLLFTGRGAKAEADLGGGDYVKAKFNPLYIELPVNVLVRFPIGNGSNVYINAGPYAAIGVAGKSKTEHRIFGVTTSGESNIKFNNDDPTTSGQEDASYNKLKRFDYGLNFGGGLSFKHIIIKANYGLGLAKINSTDTNNSSNDKNKYRTVSLSVGIPL